MHTFQSISCHHRGIGHLEDDLRPGPYLCIILKHLIALHVVALEHEDGSVKAGDVQTEVICSYFLIGSV